MILISSPVFEEHVTPPGHPERPERAHVFDVVAGDWTAAGGRTLAPRAASVSELVLAHDRGYVEQIMATKGQAVMLDEDTFTSSDSVEIALLAAGATVQAAEHALDRREPAFALVRPPGHHAERDRAMGFCLYNNVAVAAASARTRVGKVAVVDIDVHHGNRTQWTFYRDPTVLYASTHQFPFYPGTGAANEVGTGEGEGFTLNVPLEAGATDEDYALVYRAAIVPVLEQFRPDLILVSAGYDAHARDPLASMRLSTEGYAAVVSQLTHCADRLKAPIACVSEGGYELTALAACLEASFAVLDGASSMSAEPVRDAAAAPRGARALAAVRAAHAAHWQL